MIENGYHSSLFDERIAGFDDAPDASLGLPNRDVWAMPTSDAAGIHTTAQAARETGMAQSVAEAHLRGGDVYAVHFPVDPTSLRRPTVSDSGAGSTSIRTRRASTRSTVTLLSIPEAAPTR
jgi:hypothetical protein